MIHNNNNQGWYADDEEASERDFRGCIITTFWLTLGCLAIASIFMVLVL